MFCGLVGSIHIADLQTTTIQGSGAPRFRLLAPSLEHHDLLGAAPAPLRSRTKGNLQGPTLCPASEGHPLPVQARPVHTTVYPLLVYIAFGLHMLKGIGRWVVSASGPSAGSEETLDSCCLDCPVLVPVTGLLSNPILERLHDVSSS